MNQTTPLRSRLARAVLGLAATPLILTTTLPATAGHVAYGFTGTVTFDADGSRELTDFSGGFTFDAAAIDAIPDPSTGSFLASGAPFGFSLSFGDGPNLNWTSLFVLTSNDLGGEDQVGLLALGPGPDESVSLTLVNLLGTLMSDDTLAPLVAGLTLAEFDLAALRWEWSPDAWLEGTLTSLSCVTGCAGSPGSGGGGGGATPPPHAVPVPATVPLVTLALAGLAAVRRTRDV